MMFLPAWKWVGKNEVALTYDYSFTGAKDFSVNAVTGKVTEGISYPAKFTDFPFRPDGAVNLTYSPDSTKMAFTRDNNLWVVDIATKRGDPADVRRVGRDSERLLFLGVLRGDSGQTYPLLRVLVVAGLQEDRILSF